MTKQLMNTCLDSPILAVYFINLSMDGTWESGPTTVLVLLMPRMPSTSWPRSLDTTKEQWTLPEEVLGSTQKGFQPEWVSASLSNAQLMKLGTSLKI